MRRVFVLSDDRVFARMLELELSFRGYAISDEKNAELLIIDADTKGDAPRELPAVFFGRSESASKDFLHRPFEMNRLFSVIEHIFSEDGDLEPKMIGENKISVAGETVTLSGSEMALLALLFDERGTPVSRERIAAEIFPDAECGSKVADVYICYLRAKIDKRLGRSFIVTVRGKGYMIK